MRKRFALALTLTLLAIPMFIFSPASTECQDCSFKFHAAGASVEIRLSGRRWSIREEGFTQRPQEAWVEWKR